MPTVSEIVSGQIGNTLSAIRNWRGAIYNVKEYGAKGNGVISDQTFISDAIDDALAAGGGIIFFPAGTYLMSGNIIFPSNVTAWFASGAKLSLNNLVTATFNGYIDAGYYQIFSGLGTTILSSMRNESAHVEWWGALGDGVTNDSPAFQKAINEANVIKFRPVVYFIGTTVIVPQFRDLQWFGSGFRVTIFKIANNIIGFNYLRNSAFGGTTWTLKDVQIVENMLSKTSIGISFKGILGFHDNWINITDYTVAGFQIGFDLGFCGNARFTSGVAQANDVCYFLNRDTSFIWFDKCFNLDNNYFIYADDPTPDGLSNGIFINKCTSVFAAKIDIRIVGWQTIFITDGGYDLGGTATFQDSSMFFGKCTEVTITNIWIASNIVLSPNREGIELSDTHTVSIKGCSIVNNVAGIKALGNASFSTGMVIDGNKFENNTTNDIVFLANITGSKIVNNHSRSLPSRTGTNFEIYVNTPGTDYNVIKMNTFRGTTFPIPSGVNSIINENIFGIGF
ncbi:glycosyl hydrolase family 28-related protein [Paenibacillus qinlingensis]|uniref:Rhamnogalacturonase A/B/Epimerase-like pectate lyase domain-containing protein n=1 Tax=Paenibacillus qinlingensis TaxID=1837343 RepID=A0ABU1P6N5_9BACL|nr:glycosyl hydrolase family 28-related protein [Paenibacillus qinlingensis]MDR6555433.1 hypothetical protein [Paenibacillus qinlingensis]